MRRHERMNPEGKSAHCVPLSASTTKAEPTLDQHHLALQPYLEALASRMGSVAGMGFPMLMNNNLSHDQALVQALQEQVNHQAQQQGYQDQQTLQDSS